MTGPYLQVELYRPAGRLRDSVPRLLNRERSTRRPSQFTSTQQGRPARPQPELPRLADTAESRGERPSVVRRPCPWPQVLRESWRHAHAPTITNPTRGDDDDEDEDSTLPLPLPPGALPGWRRKNRVRTRRLLGSPHGRRVGLAGPWRLAGGRAYGCLLTRSRATLACGREQSACGRGRLTRTGHCRRGARRGARFSGFAAAGRARGGFRLAMRRLARAPGFLGGSGLPGVSRVRAVQASQLGRMYAGSPSARFRPSRRTGGLAARLDQKRALHCNFTG
jgi:hypothetical protein